MASFELTVEAERDLVGIYSYSFRNFGRDQADNYLIEIEECLVRLAENPEIGRSIANLRAGYFRYEHASHVIFFVKVADGIRVVRILHQRMDPAKNL
jgi:toxin ParE1/3/4